MAINLVNTFSTSDVNLTNLMSTTDKLYNVSLSLTNMNNTTVPAIAHVSTVEVNGALYQTDAETAISTTDPVTSTTVADGTVYIMLTPSVSGTTCTAAFTATAPTWSDTKQGWYGTGSFANCKYLEYLIKKDSSNYYKIQKGENIICYMNQTNKSYSSEDTVFDSAIFDNFNLFDSSNQTFQVPFSGYYKFNLSIYCGGTGAYPRYRLMDSTLTTQYILTLAPSDSNLTLFSIFYLSNSVIYKSTITPIGSGTVSVDTLGGNVSGLTIESIPGQGFII